MANGLLAGGMVALLAAGAAGAGGIGNTGMPNRISMNVTVPKQTQGATFGEKVNAGLHATGSMVEQGAALSIVVECGRAACVATLPDGGGYRADLQRRRVEVLESNRTGNTRANAARGIGQPVSLLGGALPGGSILSATMSSVGTRAGSVGAAAASDAATGPKLEGGKEGLATASRAPGVIDVLDPLADGEYLLTLLVAHPGGTRKGRDANAGGKVRIVLGFGVEAGVVRASHDTSKNAIANVR